MTRDHLHTRSTSPFVAFLVVFFLVWGIRATVFYDAVDAGIESPVARALFSNAVKALLWVVPAVAFAMWVRHKRPLAYLGMATMPTARQWAVCAGVTVAFLLIVVGVALTLEGKSFAPENLANYLTIPGLLALFISPWIEEILFRGMVLKELAGIMSGWAANLVSSLLFVGVHLPYWLWNQGFTMPVLSNCVGVLIVSLVVGWMALYTRSIWPATAAHAANNFVVSLLSA